MTDKKTENTDMFQNVTIPDAKPATEKNDTNNRPQKTHAEKTEAGLDVTNMVWWLIPIGLLLAAVVIWNSSIELGIAALAAAVVTAVIIAVVFAMKYRRKRRSRETSGSSMSSQSPTGSRGGRSRNPFRRNGKNGSGKSGTGSNSGKGKGKGKGKSARSGQAARSGGASSGKQTSGSKSSRNPFKRNKGNKGKSSSGAGQAGRSGGTGGSNRKNGSAGGGGGPRKYPNKGGRVNPVNWGKRGETAKQHLKRKGEDQKAREQAKSEKSARKIATRAAKEQHKEAKQARKQEKREIRAISQAMRDTKKSAKRMIKQDKQTAKQEARNKKSSSKSGDQSTQVETVSATDEPKPAAKTSERVPKLAVSKTSRPTNREQTSRGNPAPATQKQKSRMASKNTAPTKGQTPMSNADQITKHDVVKTIMDVHDNAIYDAKIKDQKADDLLADAHTAGSKEGISHTANSMKRAAAALQTTAADNRKFGTKLIETATSRWGNNQ